MTRVVDVRRKMGRPSKYDPAFCAIARSMAEGGSTHEEIARAMGDGVNVSTLYEWSGQHPEFSEALKGGKGLAIERVVRSLYHRAVGYEHDATKIVNNDGDIIAVNYTEHVPPDVGAIKLWLYNVDPVRFRPSREVPPDAKPELVEHALTLEQIDRRLAEIDDMRRRGEIPIAPGQALLPAPK